MTGEAEAKRLRTTRTEDRIVALLAERDNLQAESDIIQARLSSIAAELRPLLNWHAGHRMESGK